MDNLIRAADNFQGSAASVEDIKQDLFVEFMIRYPYGIIMVLLDAEKCEKITKYYFDMKFRSDAKNPSFFCVNVYGYCNDR